MNTQNANQEPELIDLYQKPEKIYTRSFSGLYRNLRLAGGTFLFLLFFGTAWLNINGQQAILFDLPARQFHIFGTTFWPQDFILLTWLLIICAFGLFALTVFAGRIWCGYTCPQSVFTWVFMWAERVTEGERNRRMKLDKEPMSADKFLRKAAKHAIWVAVAFTTALTFVGYFTPIRELVVDLTTGDVNGWGVFWLVFFTVATYGNAGYLREQVCMHMCPYARFQSVMFDNDTLVVAYDERRGESRGARKKSVDPKSVGLGDCVDCSVCVQVCPTGIDIRDGLQYQCIGCAACIDACDTIMDKMGYDKGLISYTTEHQLAGGKTHWLRPRLIGYAVALIVMIGLFFVTLNNRVALELEVLRDRNVLYRTLSDQRIENIYTLKIANKDHVAHEVQIQVDGFDGLTISGETSLMIEPNSVAQEVIRVIAPQLDGAPITRPIEFSIISSKPDLGAIKTESRFMIPSR
ncbi:cytochrome c oxidase accessory protein CcoG [uncultured Endozoicomonas sp.]|uniref:cytochrome c oxidase accessory protein CcoG n=1 Tax=uncultured Endozoicomonas sp. TaxID=432652 RepID=UPI002615BEB4|nr:cytochrome c oxidase accessory protein CcoG [uncultured Endozoicomonas sp.]